MAIWYVSTSGNDANDGTADYKPKQTIGAAVRAAGPGAHEIVVSPGVYTETVRLGADGPDQLTLSRADEEAAPPIIRGGLVVACEGVDLDLGGLLCGPPASVRRPTKGARR